MMQRSTPRLRLDHLVLGVPDLRVAVADFEDRTGLRPVFGGRHATGTANYLVGLGSGAYLEILALLPEERGNGHVQPFGIEDVSAPRLLTWCVRSADIERDARAAADRGFDVGDLLSLSRDAPDGQRLAWRMSRLEPMPFDGVVPFLIDWGQTPHPSARHALPTAELLFLEASHPHIGQASLAMRAIGVAGTLLTPGPAGLRARIRTPRGEIELR